MLSHIAKGVLPFATNFRETVDQLVASWPADRLVDLTKLMAPADVSEYVTAIRCVYLHLQSVRQQRETVGLWARVASGSSRVELLAALLEAGFHDQLFPSAFKGLLDAMAACLSFKNARSLVEPLLRIARRITAAQAELLSQDDIARLAELLRAIAIDDEKRVACLAAFGCAVSSGRSVFFEAARDVCLESHEERVYSAFDANLGEGPYPELSSLIGAIDDDLAYSAMAAVAASACDAPTVEQILERFPELKSVDARAHLLEALCPLLNSDQRINLVLREAAWADAKGARDAALYWRIRAAVDRPGTVETAEITDALAWLSPEEKVKVAWLTQEVAPPGLGIVTAALGHFAELSIEDKYGLMMVAADELSSDDIFRLLDEPLWKEKDCAKVLGCFMVRALRLKNFVLVDNILKSAPTGALEDLIDHISENLDRQGLECVADFLLPPTTDRSPRKSKYYVDSGRWKLLAHRAAALGDLVLMRRFLGAISGSSSWDMPMDQIFAAAPSSLDGDLLELATTLPYQTDRFGALQTVLGRSPWLVTRDRIEQLLSNVAYWSGIEQYRINVTTILLQLTTEDLIGFYTKSLRSVDGQTRNEVLPTLSMFLPALIARLGSDVVNGLERALRVGCRPAWP